MTVERANIEELLRRYMSAGDLWLPELTIQVQHKAFIREILLKGGYVPLFGSVVVNGWTTVTATRIFLPS